jgi:HSP20 family protein
MSHKPNQPKYPKKRRPFEDFFNSVNHFIQEPPIKGFLHHMDEFFSQPFPHSSFPLEIKETEENQIVTAQLPGVKKDQISIDILANSLTIAVKREDIFTKEDDKNMVYRRSESRQYSSRTVNFQHPVDERRAKASYQNGLLEIIVPKLRANKIDIIE